MDDQSAKKKEHELMAELIRSLASEEWQPARVRAASMDLLHVANQLIINRGNYNKQYVRDKLDSAARDLGYRLMG